MEWIRSRPNFEKIAYIIVFTIISYWIIEIKEKPFRIYTSEKYVTKKIVIDKNEYPLRPTADNYYLPRKSYNSPWLALSAHRGKIRNEKLEWWFDHILMVRESDLKKYRQEWDQGYYDKKERDGYYYHSKFNTFPFIVWLLSGFIFSSLIFSRKKDP